MSDTIKTHNPGHTKLPEPQNRSYDLLLMRLERWLDELATRGPKAMPDVYRELAVALEQGWSDDRVIEPEASFTSAEIPKPKELESYIDFDHQKNYDKRPNEAGKFIDFNHQKDYE